MRSLGLLFVLCVAAGCSLSTSAEMGSDSSRSSETSSRSSESSSRSSTSEKKASRYREDVRSYTAAYIKAGGPVEAFEKKLGELARRYGVTNWEDDPATYAGIGEGLADAGVGRVDLVAYTSQLSRSDPGKMQTIRRGYDTRQ